MSLSARPWMGRCAPGLGLGRSGARHRTQQAKRRKGFGVHINPSPARTHSLTHLGRHKLPYVVPEDCRMLGGRGAVCPGPQHASAGHTSIHGPRGLPRPLYSARPAPPTPGAPRAPPGPIHLLLRTRHRTAPSKPPGDAVGPSGLAGRGRRRDRSSFHLFLNARLKVETALASGASVAFSSRDSPSSPTPPAPFREGQRNSTRKGSYIF